MSTPSAILVVDDDVGVRRLLAALIETAGYSVCEAGNGAAALAITRERAPAAALLDVRLGSENGLELINALKSARPEMSVVMISGAGTIESAVDAMLRGADNFITKPIQRARLLAVLERALETRTLRRRTEQLERLQPGGDAAPIGDCPGLKPVLAMIEAVAPRETTVIISGETGVGKGVFARALHERSGRARKPFVSLNCAGLQRELTESELFGHERGAFTGAVERKLGLLEAAEGGTLFLDEVGEMDLAVQPKLLKVIEDRRFRRVGGVNDIVADVRLVAATHRNLQHEVAAGRFREDLLYRMNVFSILVPPLRDRSGDVLPIARQLLRNLRGVHADERAIHPDAEVILRGYRWPGNVRELRNVIERAEILCPPGSPLSPEHLPPLAPWAGEEPKAESPPLSIFKLPDRGEPQERPVKTMAEMEREQLLVAVKVCRGNMTAAARSLGIGRSTLYRKLRGLGEDPEGRAPEHAES